MSDECEVRGMAGLEVSVMEFRDENFSVILSANGDTNATAM